MLVTTPSVRPITQELTVNGETKVAKGLVVSWDSTNDVVKYIQDPKLHTDTNGILYTFSGTGSVVGVSKTGTVDSDYTADLNDLSFSGGYAPLRSPSIPVNSCICLTFHPFSDRVLGQESHLDNLILTLQNVYK